MNIPNMLTVLRLALIPVFISYFTSGALHAALAVYLIAGITDVLDGYIARRFNMKTRLGSILDPLADKLMLIAALGCLVYSRLVPAWVLYVVLIKEGIMIIGGTIMYFSKVKRVIASNFFGKIATLIFYIAVATSLLEAKPVFRDATMLGAVVMTIIAFGNYLILYWKDHPQRNSGA